MPQLPRHHQALVDRFATDLAAALADDAASAPHLLLAVSGGSDSMALLELCALARGIGRDLVVYVDHGLRPEAGSECALVCDAVEQRRGTFRRIELSLGRKDEATLRALRYEALSALADEAGAHFIVTGHTRDDQIETILHRLVRGAGRKGLSAMSARRERIVRPLLGFGKAELAQFLRERGVDWCEDPSNRSDRYVRNRIRHGVVPAIERELGRGCLDHLPEMARVWAEEEAYLDAEAARFAAYAEHGPGDDRRLDAEALFATPPALRTRVVRHWLAHVTGREPEGFSRGELERVVDLASDNRGTRRLDLPGFTVMSAYGQLRVFGDVDDEAIDFRYSLATDKVSEVVGPGGWRIAASRDRELAAEIAMSVIHEVCDFLPERLSQRLIVRSARPGDRVSAARGMRKVQDLMVDARIPSLHRATWPLVESEGEVIWVPGLARDERFVAKEAGVERVRLRWTHADVA